MEDRGVTGAGRHAEAALNRHAGLRVLAIAAALLLGGCSHLIVLHDPLSAAEHNDLGVAYEVHGQPKLAAHEYRQALRLDHHQARASVNLGNVEAGRGRWHAAEMSYRRALRDSSTDADAMNNLAIALHRQGRAPLEARTWAERAVAAGGTRDSLYRATLAEVSAGAPRTPRDRP